MKYELYHDESKEAGYWHGILLVPSERKELLLHHLSLAREKTRHHSPLGIKDVKRQGRVFSCADAWVQLGIAGMASKRKGAPIPVFAGEIVKGRKQFQQFRDIVGLKFIVLRECDGLATMSNVLDYGGKVETTFRMGLKGGLHFLGSETNPIHVERMHFDGYRHQGRHIDSNRIVERLYGLREYCSISPDENIVLDGSSDHTRADSQNYNDCQLLQLTDLLVGCFRTVLGRKTRDIHARLALPVKNLLDRYRQGYARMRNSRWSGSLCVSQCRLDESGWVFSTIEYEANVGEQLSFDFGLPIPY